jgi:glycosyltransferase involved in cell wall biosynthesis
VLNKEASSQPKVSIILPCYNVDKYLAEALDSVINQTLTDIEIIPVDDGSPDTCHSIIKSYAEKDARIKPIYKENGGYGSAVNAGINAALGEYIAILEPDDYVMHEYYNVLYQEAKEDGLDICGVNAYCEIRDMASPKLIQSHWVDNPDYLSYEGINEILAYGTVGITLKIYKRSFLIDENISLKEDLRAYHDIPFVAEALVKSSKSRIIIGTGYYYRKDEITSTTKSKKNFVGIVDAIEHVVSMMTTSKMRSSRRSAIVGYCLCHLIHYYQLTKIRFDSPSVSSFIESKIVEVLSLQEEVTIRESNKKSIISLSNGKAKVNAIKRKTILFSECPKFNIDYYKEEKRLSNVLSKLYFFSYYSFYTGRTGDVVDFRENVLGILWYVPGLNDKPLEDFIRKYLEGAVFDFVKNCKERWYIVFFWYLKNNDSKYFSNILESINETKVSESIVQYYPEITQEFPYDFSNLSDNFRKTKVIRQSIINQEAAFLKYAEGKSIAVVGNAPCELGLNKGREIDNHDIIIRFNNYSTSNEFIKDYGEKTNVWAITPGIESLNYQEELYEYDFVMSPTLGMQLSEVRLETLYNYIISGGRYFQFDSIGCRRRFNMMIPSVGLYTLNYLSENLENLGKVEMYGFAPKTAKKDNRHYFKGDPVPTKNLSFHDWDREAVFVDNLSNVFLEHNRRLV